jgi:hypothetical protein
MIRHTVFDYLLQCFKMLHQLLSRSHSNRVIKTASVVLSCFAAERKLFEGLWFGEHVKCSESDLAVGKKAVNTD